MEALFVLGAGGIILYNTMKKQPQPDEEHDKGTALPNPRFLYSNPANWSSAPVDITYRGGQSFYGPLNDPRIRYQLHGGARVVHSGYGSNFVRTNLVWNNTSENTSDSGKPAYIIRPNVGIGEPKLVTDTTIGYE